MRPLIAFSLLASSFVVACAPTAESVARGRAANEFGCPESQIVTSELSPGTEVVDACGHHAVYTCPRDRTHRVCIREASSAEAPSSQPPAP